MIGKLLLAHLLVLAIWSATTTAETAPIIPCFINNFEVEIDNKIVKYYGVEIYFKYDRDNLYAYKYAASNLINIFVKDTGVIFRGDAYENPDKYSVKKEILIESNTVGVSNTWGISPGGGTLRECGFTITKNKNTRSDLPESLLEKVFKQASICLKRSLCQAISNVNDNDLARGKNNPLVIEN